MGLTNDVANAFESLVQQGQGAQAKGEYWQAETAYQLALLMADGCCAVTPYSVHGALMMLANLYAENNHFDLAERTLRRALHTGENTISEADRAVVFRELAQSLRAQGRFFEANVCNCAANKLIAETRKALERQFSAPPADKSAAMTTCSGEPGPIARGATLGALLTAILWGVFCLAAAAI